jgi:hypothetical protein
VLGKVHDLHGVRVLECSAQGPILRGDQDALAVILEAIAGEAGLIVIPVSRLDADFFQLRTGLAGEMVQKFVNYRRKVAIVGDFLELASSSASLRAFIDESNRGNTIWFVTDMAQLEKRLALYEGSLF